MGRFRRGIDWKLILRFYAFALPHWKLVIPSFVALLICAAMNVNLLVMVKPAVEAVQYKEQKAAQARGESQEPTELLAEAPPEEESLLEETKRKATDWFMSLGPVAALNNWVWSGDPVKKLAFLLAAVFAPVLFAAGFAYEYIHRRVVWAVMTDVRVAVFQRVSSLSLSYFAARRTGDLVSRLTNDITNAQTALKLMFGRIIQQPLYLVAFFGVALVSSWQLTVIAVVCFPALALLQGRYGRRIRRHSTKNLERLADVTDSITQTLQGIRVVKSFDGEKREAESFRGRAMEQLRRAIKLVRTRAWADTLPSLFLVEVFALVVIVAGGLVGAGKLGLSNLLRCFAALAATAGPLRRIVKAYNDLQQSSAGVARLFELLDAEPRIRDHPEAVEIDGVREGVRFSDVWFSYDSEPVLKGIDLFVPAGKTYAIVGETGAGKSTLLDLVARFYDVDSGAVSVDGVDVRRIKRSSLMQQIAIVGQHPFLFNRTIAENIRYGDPDATDQQVQAAARAASVHEFVASLPEGYETMVGERGDRLSGGQRQCITIARAILKDAPVLILDEATSNLDAQSEMLVRTALSNLMQGRTTFVIAHRLSTVRDADRIVVLRDGQILEEGTHGELLQRGGEYERLYRLQFFEDPQDATASPAAED
ncbi:MAG: ABC transporter ATP-binding protein [Candidatus Brocadiia bacterium]